MKKIFKLLSLGIMLAFVALVPMGCSDNSANKTTPQLENERVRYTVTFNLCGGKSRQDGDTYIEEVDSGDYVEKPDVWNTGYSLVGWYKDAEYTTQFNFYNRIYENMNLYAKWETAVYTVTFKDEYGGTGTTGVEVEHGETVTAPTRTKEGWTLSWCPRSFTDDWGKYVVDFTEPITSDETYYAVWTKRTDDFEIIMTGRDRYNISKYIGKNKTKVEVPKKIDGLELHTICAEAFKGDTTLRGIDVKGVVYFIRERAFDCPNLEYIIFRESVGYVYADYCNYGVSVYCCQNSNLDELKSNQKNEDEEYVWRVFNNCSVWGDYIEYYDFRDRYEKDGHSYMNVYVLGYIGDGGAIELPDDVSVIGQRAFYNNKSITSVTIPSDCREVGNYAFWGCSNITTVNWLGDSTKVWKGSEAFNFSGN